MKIDRRTFIRKMNWGLAGIIGMLGFAGCEKENEGTYYTVKGTVVNKATGKPIDEILVGYQDTRIGLMYGSPPANYKPKAHVLTNAKGEFKLTDRFNDEEFQTETGSKILPVYVEDIDGEKNGLFQEEYLYVEFRKGVYTATVKVELTEIENE